MNNNKYLKLQNQFENTIDRICHSNGEFNKFLITAAHNFRFAFNNAVVTYAQAPDATALLTYDQWQLYGRVPKRYSKSILLFDNEMPGKYSVTFDYAKTTIDKRVQYPKTIKFFNYQSTPEVAGAIKLLYQVNTPSNLLSDILLNISKQNVDANTPADTTEKLRDLYSKVVTNMLCSRFTDIGTPYEHLLPKGGINQAELNDTYDFSIKIFRSIYTKLANNLPESLSSIKGADPEEATEPLNTEKIPSDVINYTLPNAPIEQLLTQQDVDDILCGFTVTVDFKNRIFNYFTENHTLKEKSDFLKKEYGSGGGSFTKSDGSKIYINYGNRGISVNTTVQNTENTISFRSIAKRISELVEDNRYLSEQEKQDYLYYIAKEQSYGLDKITNASFNYSTGDTVTFSAVPYNITEINDDIISVVQENAPLFSKDYTREEFDNLLFSNLHTNKHLIVSNTLIKEATKNNTLWNTYQQAQEERPYAVLLFKVGDFYEIIGDNAKRVADILDLQLTSRNIGGKKLPITGFPASMLSKYEDILLSAGESLSFYSDNPNIKEEAIDYFFLRPESKDIVWVHYRHNDNGSGQIVRNTISIEDVIQAVNLNSVSDFEQYLGEHCTQTITDTTGVNTYNKIIYDSPYDIVSWDNKSLSDIKDVFIEYAEALRLHNNPEVLINFSEHPALYDIAHNKERISFPYANKLLGSLDMIENAKRSDPKNGFYYKTDFKIFLSYDGVHINTYSGRYDLADGETNIIGHITSYRDYLVSDNKSDKEIQQYDKLINELKESIYLSPLSESEKTEIYDIASADYGLDFDDSTKTVLANPTEEIINITSKGTENYVITNNEIGSGAKSQRFNNNITAIRLINKLQSEGRSATAAEQSVLAKYVGWGGLADCFKEGHSKFNELKTALSPADYISAKQSTLTAFYTPPVVIKAVYKTLNNLGFEKGSILDPACGTGHFFGLLPEYMQDSRLYGVEIDHISGLIAQHLYPNANIIIDGFENTNIPNNYIDAVIGNVPFGDFKVFDKIYNKHHLLIHDYFFVKALDKLRPGGILAFVTSKGTLDKQNSKVRKMLSEKADLLGAIRLPNSTFKSVAGTDVTSDIIFLQKKSEAIKLNDYPEWIDTVPNADGIVINRYFIDHPEMICGHMEMTTNQFGMDSVCIADEGVSLAEQLDKAISNIKGEYHPYTFENDNQDNSESIIADENARNFSYYSDGNTEKIYYRENGIMTECDFSGVKCDRIKGMIGIVDITRQLIDAESNNYSDEITEPLRDSLNKCYDDFVSRYGSLNSYANSCFREDNSYPLLQSLENIIDGNSKSNPIVEKADIFRERTISPYIEINSAETPEEALIISMSQKGKVDLEYMAQLTGDTQESIINALNGNKIYLKPYEDEYVTADEYLSGNVKQKLKTAEQAAQEDAKYAVNVQALEKVIPKDIKSSEISVHLGTTWIPIEDINDFMNETFNIKPYLKNSIHIEFMEYTGTYYITGKNADLMSVEAHERFGTSRRNGYQILEDSLNLKTSKVFDTFTDADGKIRQQLNHKETLLAQNKQDLIKSQFNDWIFKSPDRRRRLSRIYNDKFNCIVPRNYNGAHLSFPGSNPTVKLRSHQLNAIARILYGGNTLLGHCVGAGKTYEMIASAMKLKELGLVHKSLIVVPKHITGQTGIEFLKLYPSANILVANEEDFTPQRRKRFCTRIATGDYDAIIIGHTQFDKLPLKPETQMDTLNEQLDEIISNIESAKRDNMAGMTIKSLERSRKKIEVKLKELQSRINRDSIISFEELGVDQVFIDEAHYFKNLYIYTKMTNVAGIGTGTESGRASDLYSKIKYLNRINPGRGVVFATGTPISNTMSEMFTMQRYLQPEMLRSMNLQNFDSWASTFGETVTALELAPEGTTYRAKTRFSKFNNIPELMSMFHEFADIQTADTLNLPVPNVERTIVEVLPTEEQKNMIADLGERAEKIRVKNLTLRLIIC